MLDDVKMEEMILMDVFSERLTIKEASSVWNNRDRRPQNRMQLVKTKEANNEANFLLTRPHVSSISI